MSLIVVILFLLGVYMLYSLRLSNERIEAELREIRLKCVAPGASAAPLAAPAPAPVPSLPGLLRGFLAALLPPAPSAGA